MARVAAQGDLRPMQGHTEAMADLKRILDSREPLYRKADITLDTAGEDAAAKPFQAAPGRAGLTSAAGEPHGTGDRTRRPTDSSPKPPRFVTFDTHPDRYAHWKLAFDGPIATLTMDVDEDRGIRPGYKLKLNSYDLGVDIELADALQRIRFEHPEVRSVVVTSAQEPRVLLRRQHLHARTSRRTRGK